LPSPFDLYAAAFASPYRQSLMGEQADVVLRGGGAGSGGPTGGDVPLRAILYEERQEEPDAVSVAGGLSMRWSGVTRVVEFQASELERADVRPEIGMKVVVDGVVWPIRRVVARNDHLTQVECERKVEHRGVQARGGER
jgi:hypothetical protein